MHFSSRFSRFLLPLLACVAGLLAAGCAGLEGIMPKAGTDTTVTSGHGSPDINNARSEGYNGPKARIAVARFTNKAKNAGWYSSGLGEGMADQLTTALVSSGRYIVVDRQDVDTVITEQDFGLSGRVKGATAAKLGQIEGAELLVVAVVTEFEDNAGGSSGSSGSSGGGAGVAGGVIGIVGGAMKQTHMSIDLKVIDATTSRILAATSVEGSASNVSLDGIIGGITKVGGLAGGVKSWENTPKEKVLREVIEQAVAFIASKTPSEFFRYGSGGSTARRSSGGSAAIVDPGVKEAQALLNKLGYNAGPADGLMGGRTRTALNEFQNDRGLSVTGQADTDTLAALRDAQ
ncbi:MAG: CsgG/HfaB family protein [Panacagrimonas sp.]